MVQSIGDAVVLSVAAHELRQVFPGVARLQPHPDSGYLVAALHPQRQRCIIGERVRLPYITQHHFNAPMAGLPHDAPLR
jgi:hypothetical protein